MIEQQIANAMSLRGYTEAARGFLFRCYAGELSSARLTHLKVVWL